MSCALSALVPVRNVQDYLEPALVRLLENLAEFTRVVELVAIDDGSTDATIEVASEMTAQYPQMKVIRYGQPRGWAEAIRAALVEATGQILFFEEPGCRLPLDELPWLWNATAKHSIVIGRAATSVSAGKVLTGGLDPWVGTYQFVRRSVLERLALQLTDKLSFRDLLLREGMAWHERIISGRPRRDQEVLYPLGQEPSSLPERTDEPQSRASPPNYLARLAGDKIPEFSED